MQSLDDAWTLSSIVLITPDSPRIDLLDCCRFAEIEFRDRIPLRARAFTPSSPQYPMGPLRGRSNSLPFFIQSTRNITTDTTS